MITLADMMQQLRKRMANGKPKPCDLVFVEASRRNRTGGRIRQLHHVTLLTQKRQSSRRINVLARGVKHPICIHIDLILYFNLIPVA